MSVTVVVTYQAIFFYFSQHHFKHANPAIPRGSVHLSGDSPPSNRQHPHGRGVFSPRTSRVLLLQAKVAVLCCSAAKAI